MAVYIFKCSVCGELSEVSMTISKFIKEVKKNKSTKCPLCGKKALLQVSSSSFHLKGDGWYVTDYQSKSTIKKKKKK